MAQAVEESREFPLDGDDQFPIHFRGFGLCVYTNPSGEVFVKDEKTGTTMRMSQHHRGGLQFTTDGKVEPERVAGTIGWQVSPR